jgi:phage/plasmid-associated DNA primase
MDQKIAQWGEPLAWLLLKHLQEPRCEDPEEVITATKNYRKANDILDGFMHVHVQTDEKHYITKFDAYEMFKEYCRDSCGNKKSLTFIEFVKAISHTKKLGEPNMENGDGWRGYRLKSTRGDPLIKAASNQPLPEAEARAC